MIRYAPMFMKLLLTALVIAGALLALRIRNQKATPLRTVKVVQVAGPKNTRLVRFAAVAAVFLMLAGAGGYLYYQWSDSYQVVTLRVVDSRSGKAVTYQAYKGDVEGRSFLTTDGRQVTLAEVERLEIGGK
jgi:hypothetical protein